MKSIKLLSLLLFVVCIFLQDNFAQNKSHSQELLTDIGKREDDSENVLKKLEKALIPVAQSHIKELKVTDVKIDRKTGLISLEATDSKGKQKTIDNVATSSHYVVVPSPQTPQEDKTWLEELWDWLFDIFEEEDALIPLKKPNITQGLETL